MSVTNLELKKAGDEVYLSFLDPENGNDRIFELRDDGVYENKGPLDVEEYNSIRRDGLYCRETDEGDQYEPVNLREELIKMAEKGNHGNY